MKLEVVRTVACCARMLHLTGIRLPIRSSVSLWNRRRFSWIARTSFSRLRPSPELDGDSDDIAALLTKEMRKFMELVAASPPDPWFHRKSEKLVLAVLMVSVDGGARFVSGINAEVSLPAGGSFCAERSAIVAARAQFPGILRSDFKGISVVEVPLVPDWSTDSPPRLTNPCRRPTHMSSCAECCADIATLSHFSCHESQLNAPLNLHLSQPRYG